MTPAAEGQGATRPWVEWTLDILLAAGVFVAVVAESLLSQLSLSDDDEGPRIIRPDQLEPRMRGDGFRFEEFEPWHEVDPGFSPGMFGLVLLVASLAAAGVLIRRRFPPAAIALASLAAVLGAFALGLPLATSVAFALCLYSLAVEKGLPPAIITAVAGTVTATAAAAATDSETDGAGLAVVLFVLVGAIVPLLAAAVTRSRRAYLREVEARLQQTQAQERARTAQALADERVKLARDLHDVLAHSLTVVNMQVGVASHLIGEHPDRAARALDEARAAGTAAVTELRSTLALLRGDQSEGQAPVPGLSDISPLVERVRATGLPVELTWQVPAGAPVPSATALLAYRLVQEGLTNVVKHAGLDAPTAVGVRVLDGALVAQVVNNPGTGGSSAAPGIGLEGLRSRVAAVGGQFRAGPLPTGGFEVAATLPLEAAGIPSAPAVPPAGAPPATPPADPWTTVASTTQEDPA